MEGRCQLDDGVTQNLPLSLISHFHQFLHTHTHTKLSTERPLRKAECSHPLWAPERRTGARPHKPPPPATELSTDVPCNGESQQSWYNIVSQSRDIFSYVFPPGCSLHFQGEAERVIESLAPERSLDLAFIVPSCGFLSKLIFCSFDTSLATSRLQAVLRNSSNQISHHNGSPDAASVPSLTAPDSECFKGAVRTAGKHPSVSEENEVLLPPDSDWPLYLWQENVAGPMCVSFWLEECCRVLNNTSWFVKISPANNLEASQNPVSRASYIISESNPLRADHEVRPLTVLLNWPPYCCHRNQSVWETGWLCGIQVKHWVFALQTKRWGSRHDSNGVTGL